MKNIFITIFLFYISLISNAEAKYLNKPIRIIGDKVNVKSEPNIGSKTLCQLSILETIRIIKINNKEVILDNNKGKWVYVRTGVFKKKGSKEKIEGWIFDYFLGYDEKFIKVKGWKLKEYAFCIGDYCPIYQFNKNGSFKYSYNICELGKCGKESIKDGSKKCSCNGEVLKNDECYGDGHLYQYKNIIWAKNSSKCESDYFYFDDKSKLRSGFDEDEE